MRHIRLLPYVRFVIYALTERILKESWELPESNPLVEVEGSDPRLYKSRLYIMYIVNPNISVISGGLYIASDLRFYPLRGLF